MCTSLLFHYFSTAVAHMQYQANEVAAVQGRAKEAQPSESSAASPTSSVEAAAEAAEALVAVAANGVNGITANGNGISAGT